VSPDEDLTNIWNEIQNQVGVSKVIDDPKPGGAPPPIGVVTPAQIAAMYDRTSGVSGWTAELSEHDIVLTPPPGYVVVYGEDGSRRLDRAPDPDEYGVLVRKTAE